jgi:hypothetical protein
MSVLKSLKTYTLIVPYWLFSEEMVQPKLKSNLLSFLLGSYLQQK